MAWSISSNPIDYQPPQPQPAPQPKSVGPTGFWQRIAQVGIGKVNALNAYRTLVEHKGAVDSNNSIVKNAARDTGHAGSAVGRFLFSNTARFANQAYQEGKQVVDTARMEAANATHNPEAFSNANKQSQQDYKGFNKKKGGILGVGTFSSEKAAKQGSWKQGVKDIGGGTLATASEIVPMGKLTKAGKVYKLARGAEEGDKALSVGERAVRAGKDVAKQAAVGAGAGSAGTAGSELVQNGKVNAKDVFMGGVKGAIIGGGLTGGVHLLHGATGSLKTALTRGPKAALADLKGSKGNVQNDVMTNDQATHVAQHGTLDANPKVTDQSSGATKINVRQPKLLQKGAIGKLEAGGKDMNQSTKTITTPKTIPMSDEEYIKRSNDIAASHDKQTQEVMKSMEKQPAIDGYHTTQQLAQDHADMMRNMDAGAKGGQMQKTADGGYVRTSDHTPFYRDYYAEHGRAPSKAAYLEQAYKELQSGKAPYGMSDAYKQLADRETQAVQKITEAHNALHEQLDHEYTNGKPNPDYKPPQKVETGFVMGKKAAASATPAAQKAQRRISQIDTIIQKAQKQGTTKSADQMRALLKEKRDLQDVASGKTTPVEKKPSAQAAKLRAASARTTTRQTNVTAEVPATTEAKTTSRQSSGSTQGAGTTNSSVKITNPRGGNAVAGSAIRSEERAVKKHLADDFSNLATYEQGSHNQEAENAVKLLHDNPEKARAIAFGQKAGNNAIHEVAVRRAVETKALNEGDTVTLRRLVSSGQHTATSEAAQRLSAEAYNANPHSPVTAMQDLVAARRTAFEKGGKSFNQELSRETSKVMAEAVHRPTAVEWHAFVDNLPEGKGNQQLVAALKSREVTPEKLSSLSSEDRQAYLKQFVGKDAQKVNAQFESKLLLKNQKAGMLSWAKKATNISPVVRKDLIQKIESIQHVLDPEDGKAFYRDLASTKLGVNVTEEEAKTIAKLSRDVQAARDAMDNGGNRLAYGRAVVKMDNYVTELKTHALNLKLRDFAHTPMGATKELLKQTAGNAKAINASMDNSAIFRQGWKTMWTHPGVWAKNAKASFGNLVKQFGGHEVMDEVRADILSRPTYDKMVKAKLAVGNLEEAFPTTTPEKIPLLGRAYKASEAAYTAFVQKTRADVFDHYLQIAEKAGVDTNDPQQLQAIGKLVNSLTGRGSLGKLEPVGDTVNNFFFSPRFVKSNWDTLTLHAGDKGVTPFARKQAAKNLLKIIGGTVGVMTIANAVSPGSAELDPRSSDFGKIKVGDTRFDITGGMGSLATLATRFITVSSKSSITHQVTKLNSQKFGSQTVMDVFNNFLENKLSPVPGVVRDYMKGTDPSGNKFSVGNELANMFTPIGVQNFKQQSGDQHSANIVMTTILDGLGISANTFGSTVSGNSPWDTSQSKEVAAFKQKVGNQQFKQASGDYKSQLDTFMSGIVKSKDYNNLPVDQQKQVVTMEKAKLQKQIFKNYGYKYKAPKGQSSQLKKFLK